MPPESVRIPHYSKAAPCMVFKPPRFKGDTHRSIILVSRGVTNETHTHTNTHTQILPLTLHPPQGRDPALLEHLAQYITDEARDKCKRELDVSGWPRRFSREAPQQKNGCDCGVFTIM